MDDKGVLIKGKLGKRIKYRRSGYEAAKRCGLKYCSTKQKRLAMPMIYQKLNHV